MSFFNNLSTLFAAQKAREHGGALGPAKPVTPTPTAVTTTAATASVASPKVIPIQPIATKGKKGKPVAAITYPAPRPLTPLVDESSVREAQAKAREIVVEAKAEALTIRSQAELEQRESMRRLEDQQRSLDKKLDSLDFKLSQMDQKELTLEGEKAKLVQQRQLLEQKQVELNNKLQELAGMSSDDAKALLLGELDTALMKEKAQAIRKAAEAARVNITEEVRNILLDAMMHGATDYVPEYTVSVVTLPNEETKGKIIGKSGRNINAFEHATGVDVDLDMSPTEVRLSCFDPVRREIGRISLERLIKDGRIQPSRIEETVEKVRGEMDRIVFEAGKNLCHSLGVYDFPNDLMAMLGKFKYRFSYGQNLIAHTMEETKIAQKLASELKADVGLVTRGALMHDIGKVSEEAEGSHVELGITIAKRFNMPQGVIDCIAQHHEDEPFTGPEQMIVYIADAISGSRPGARYENYDVYVQRLAQLEAIATQYPEVQQAYAIQAGREVRVLLDPEVSKDDDVTALSMKIRDEIQTKMTYPGTVTVTVVRERRNQQVAK